MTQTDMTKCTWVLDLHNAPVNCNSHLTSGNGGDMDFQIHHKFQCPNPVGHSMVTNPLPLEGNNLTTFQHFFCLF